MFSYCWKGGITWGPAFCPLVWMRGWEATDRKFNTNGTNWDFPFFRSVSLLSPLGGRFLGWFWAVLGGQNWDRILMITRVGFGRTELSLRLSCTEFCALSSGHGPRNPWFEGGGETLDFHDFLYFFGVFRKVLAKCPENQLKIHWNHWKINGKSAET